MKFRVERTVVTIEYDCGNGCRYDIPATLAADQLALRQAALIDTLAMLADVQHDRECPARDDG